MANKRKVLIIPHQPHRQLRVRALEMARHLAALGRYDVHVLTWTLSQPGSANPLVKIPRKLLEASRTLATPVRVVQAEGLNWVQISYLLAPAGLCQWFNRAQLARWMAEAGIEILISANAYHFSMPRTGAWRCIYDVVDDHISSDSGPHWRMTRAFTLNELRKADRICTISHQLETLLRTEGFPNVARIPNGVDIRGFESVSTASVQAIQRRYNLEGKFVIGYIGNHGWWSGMDLLLAAFSRLRERLPQARLLIVGPGEELPRYQEATAGDPDIVWTGPVLPEEVTAYFHASSIGVLPFQPCPFTDNALPLKILEYGAARKRVLATPLKELQTLAFPHVRLLEPDADRWAEALTAMAGEDFSWPAEWDKMIAAYDWPVVLRALEDMLEDGRADAV